MRGARVAKALCVCTITMFMAVDKAEAAGRVGVRQPASGRAAAWRAIARLPDWGGTWYLATGGQFSRGGVAGASPPQMTPEGAARLKTADELYFKQGVNPPLQNCLPDGMPHIMDYAFPIEIYFTPDKVVIYTEAYGQVRWIFTDGRKQNPDLPPTYNGHSIGHWEGDTLVADTVGMIPQTQLVVSNNFLGMRHSDQLRLTERIHLIAKDVLEITTTVADPVIFAKPWVTVKTYKRRRGPLAAASEYVCSNNREPLDANGKQTFQFNPPKN